MKLFFMMAYHHWPEPSPVMVELVEQLRRRGFLVDLGLASQQPIAAAQWRPQYDLYILKSHSLYWAQMAAALEAQGARLLDPVAARFRLMSKARLASRLHQAGLPHPATWSITETSQLAPLLQQRPGQRWILKPDAGARGRGIIHIGDQAELDALAPLTEPYVAQPYHPHEPEDIKAYVIGETIVAMRKAFGPKSFKQPGRPCVLTPDQEALIRACGEACGVSLYGVDLIETPKGPIIVDANWFPSYRSIPQAATHLADWIATQATTGATS